MKDSSSTAEGPAVHELPGFLPAFAAARRAAPHIPAGVWRDVANTRHASLRGKRCEAWFLTSVAAQCYERRRGVA